MGSISKNHGLSPWARIAMETCSGILVGFISIKRQRKTKPGHASPDQSRSGTMYATPSRYFFFNYYVTLTKYDVITKFISGEY